MSAHPPDIRYLDKAVIVLTRQKAWLTVWLNQSLNVNFATAASSNATTPGFTLGLGGEYQPSSWRLFGSPVSVFMQYQHTRWNAANFNAPPSSPAFNYAFKREDDTIRLGFNVYLSAPTPPPPTRGLITK
jgi:hypothetical protein